METADAGSHAAAGDSPSEPPESSGPAGEGAAGRPAAGPGGPAEPPDADTGGRRRSSDFVQSLERGLSVIRAFGPDQTSLTLSDVARRTGLTRAAARRFLLTLVELGYMHFDGRVFSLRPRVLELGYSYISTLSFADVAVPSMKDLVARVSASASMAVLDGDDVVYVAHVSARRMLAVTVPVGTRFPAHATSMGQVLLAALPGPELRRYLDRSDRRALTPQTVVDRADLVTLLDSVMRRGYALGDGGLEEGLHGVAVPVTDGKGSVVAALGVSAHLGYQGAETLRGEYLPALLDTADQISAQLRSLNSPVTR